MMRKYFWLASALALVSCQEAQQPNQPPQTPTPPEAVASGADEAEAPAGGARQVKEETDTFVFEYSYPQAAGDNPVLAKWLDNQLEKRRDELALNAARDKETARDNGFPFNKYFSTTEWQVVADLPGWLSLSAEISTYTGGAHSNYGFDSMVWDEERNIPVEPIAFFTSPDALDAVLGKELCEQLNKERGKRRGEPVPEGSTEMFDACVAISEPNLLLGSAGGHKFDRIGVKIAPYIAGPWVEGSYEFTFAMTPAMLETVRPEYREIFAVGK
ncbi:DUF4163 domain-containing protein [Aurantiacibacter xanthus]|nr:DUF4163 domain-containing protein [Aurantiacibacter xanthus]